MNLRKASLTIFIVLSLLLPGTADEIAEKLNQKINTNFVGTSLGNVLRMLSKQYSINIVIGGAAKERITLQLYNVTLRDALNTILQANGYHYVVGKNILLVKPLAMETHGEMETKVFHLKYKDGFKLKAMLQPLLSERGKIEALLSEVDEKNKGGRSNHIVLTDLWEKMATIEQVIEEMDRPEEQLQIEVRLVEKVVRNEKKVGLNLPKGVSVKMTGAELSAPITQPGGGTQGTPTLLSAWYELPDAGSNMNLGVLTVNDLKATLDFLAQDDGSKLLSNPKVTTLNNKRALIKIGTTIPVPEISRGIAGDLLTYKDKDVNMVLEVTPRIGKNDQITLDLHPILEEIVGYTGSVEAPQPITSRREVQSTIQLYNGETLVIGGLIKESKTEMENKVWLLGDIPILGYLFTHFSTKIEKSELLIFITTKILDEHQKAVN